MIVGVWDREIYGGTVKTAVWLSEIGGDVIVGV